MSSYIVDDVTINRILGAMDQASWSFRVGSGAETLVEPNEFRWLISMAEDEPDVWELWDGSLSQLGKAMREMNARALDDRYGEGTYESDGYAPYEYKEVGAESPYQVLKSMRCYLYQCSEGHVLNEPLYKWIEKLAYALAHDIATSAPEYKDAEWR